MSIPFALVVVGLLLMVVAHLFGQEFRPAGYIEKDCRGHWTAVWTNTPPHVFVQGTLDTTNWVDLIEVRRIGLTNVGAFYYPIPTQDAAVFYRLRIVQ